MVGGVRNKTIRLHTTRLLLHTLHNLKIIGNIIVQCKSYKEEDTEIYCRCSSPICIDNQVLDRH